MRPKLLTALQRLHARFAPGIFATLFGSPHEVTRDPAFIVAPHQDDETIGCGGLIALKRQGGAPVSVAFLTDGILGTEPAGGSGPGTADLVQRRNAEAIAALAILGVPAQQVHFLSYQDGGLSSLDAKQRLNLTRVLGSLITESRSVEIYTPHQHDGHPDHEAAFALTVEAVAHSRTTPRIFQYGIWIWWTQPFLWRLLLKRTLPLRSLAISAVLRQKLEALQCHQSQLCRLPEVMVRSCAWPREIYFAHAPLPG